MTTPLRAQNLEIVSRMPWLAAEHGSIWSISGTYGRNMGVFRHELAIAENHPDQPQPRFTLIQTDTDRRMWPVPCINADQVSHADRLVLVRAADPREAHYLDDQDLIDPDRNAPLRAARRL